MINSRFEIKWIYEQNIIPQNENGNEIHLESVKMNEIAFEF